MRPGIIKKILAGAGILLSAVFIYIALNKNRNVSLNDNSGNTTGIQKNENIQEFWKIYRQATAHRMKQEWTDAIEDYQHALRLNPEHKDALYYIGNMYLETGREMDAEKAWLKLLSLNPESARAHFQLGNLYLYALTPSLHNPYRAKTEFEKTFSINKDFLQPLIKLGEIAIYNNHFTEALHYFQTVLGTDKRNTESNLLAGYVMYKLKQADKALEYFTYACQSITRSERPAGTTKEGDTQGGKPLTRSFNNSLRTLIHSLPAKSDNHELTNEMILFYQKLDSLFIQL